MPPHCTAQALRAEAAAYARRPRRMLRSHDHQRESRKLRMHAAAFCLPYANHVPHYTARALCAHDKRAVVLPHAFGLPAIVSGWTWCATSTESTAAASTATTTTMHSPTHRRLRQALRRQRCTARPRFTRPAWPRRALRSNHQRDSGETRFALSLFAFRLVLPEHNLHATGGFAWKLPL